MNQAIRKFLALAAVGAAGLAATGAAHAGGVNWHIGINLPGVFYPAPPPVVYAPPPPVVYAPPPVVYAPPPVVYRPAPIVYHQPAPVYVQPHPRGYWREGRWHDHRGKGRWDDDDRRAYKHHKHYKGDGYRY